MIPVKARENMQPPVKHAGKYCSALETGKKRGKHVSNKKGKNRVTDETRGKACN